MVNQRKLYCFYECLFCWCLYLDLKILLVLPIPQNFSDYQVMSGGRGVIVKIYFIVFNDTVIDQKSEIMLLGVMLDDQLSFSSKQCL